MRIFVKLLLFSMMISHFAWCSLGDDGEGVTGLSQVMDKGYVPDGSENQPPIVAQELSPEEAANIDPNSNDEGVYKYETINPEELDQRSACAGKCAIPKPNMACAQSGIASTYGLNDGFQGKKTADGETFNTYALTAADKTLPMNTYVRVANSHTGESVVVRINDRGPYVKGRVIDLSYKAATALGMGDGTAPVTIKCI